jgi:predicted dehydrogenase
MTTRVADAERVLQAARKSKRVALALPYLFNPWTVKIEQLITKGAVGKIRMVRCRISHDANHSKMVWFARKKESHGGALFDMGVYSAALMVQLFGGVKAVSGMFPESTDGVDVEQGAAMTLRFASGAIGVLATSWQEIGWKAQVEVFGTTGTLECIGWPGEPVILHAKKAPRGKLAGYRPVPLPKRIPMPTNVCRHWADCILKGAEPLIPVSRGRHLVDILCAGYKAVETGRQMPIKSRP